MSVARSVKASPAAACPWAAGRRGRVRPAPRGDSLTSSAPRFSFTRSRVDDLGMVTTPGWASSQASASCAGVQPTSSASFLSAGLPQQPALVERRIGHQRDRALAHPRQQVELGPAARQAVEHLVAAGQALVEARRVFHVAAVEVADAEIGDLSRRAQAVERLERLLEPRAAAPVQQVEIDALDAQALQAALAGGDGAGARGVVRIDLAHDVGPRARGPRSPRRRSPRRRPRRTSRRCRSSDSRARARISAHRAPRRAAARFRPCARCRGRTPALPRRTEVCRNASGTSMIATQGR